MGKPGEVIGESGSKINGLFVVSEAYLRRVEGSELKMRMT